MPFPRNIAGDKFGRLTAVEPCGKQKRETVWLCKCSCGGTALVRLSNLTNNNTRSCGCLKRGMVEDAA